MNDLMTDLLAEFDMNFDNILCLEDYSVRYRIIIIILICN